MRAALYLLPIGLFAGSAPAVPQMWATVPASKESGRLEVFPVPSPPGDGVVTLVGGPRPAEDPVPPRIVVVALDLPVPVTGPVQAEQAKREDMLPPEAIWPGPDGRISVPADDADHPGATPKLRNPWDVRIRPRRELAQSTFLDGGIIEGGASPVALLNGRVAQKGSSFDGFEVAAVVSSAVVVRRGGRSYVLPIGRRVTIETIQP